MAQWCEKTARGDSGEPGPPSDWPADAVTNIVKNYPVMEFYEAKNFYQTK